MWKFKDKIIAKQYQLDFFISHYKSLGYTLVLHSVFKFSFLVSLWGSHFIDYETQAQRQ